MQGRDLNESKAAQERAEPEVWMQRDCLHVWECSEWVAENGELSVTPLISTAHRQCTAYTDHTNTTLEHNRARAHNMYRGSHTTTTLQHGRARTLYVHPVIILIKSNRRESTWADPSRILQYSTDFFFIAQMFYRHRENRSLIAEGSLSNL